MNIKTHLYEYSCAFCKSKFKAPVYPISDMSYGEFLLRNKNNDSVVYLNALSDKAFNEQVIFSMNAY